MQHTVRYKGKAAALQGREQLRKALHENARRKRAALGIPADDKRWAWRWAREDGSGARLAYTGENVITWADGRETSMEVDEFIRTFRDGIILKAVQDDVVYTVSRQAELMNLLRETRNEIRIARKYVTEDGRIIIGPSETLGQSSDTRISEAISEAWHHQQAVRNAEMADRRHVVMDRNADEYAARLAKLKNADAYQELKDYILGIKDTERRHALIRENADLFGDMAERFDADMEEEADGAGYVMRSYGTITRPESE